MLVRLARPEDDALLADLLARCSAETLYRRFHGTPSALVRQQFVAAGVVAPAPERAAQPVGVGAGSAPDHLQGSTRAPGRSLPTVGPLADGPPLALVTRSWVAEAQGALRGIATLVVGAGGTGEIAVLVEDDWARRGVGRRMADALVQDASRAGLTCLEAYIQPENVAARAFFRSLAPGARASFEARELVVRIPLVSGSTRPSIPSQERPGAPEGGVPPTGSARPVRYRPRTTVLPPRQPRRRTDAG